jgi:hypothetical protein
VQIAEKHYLGLMRGIPRDARTLEQAMAIEGTMRLIVTRVSLPGGNRTPARASARLD